MLLSYPKKNRALAHTSLREDHTPVHAVVPKSLTQFMKRPVTV